MHLCGDPTPHPAHSEPCTVPSLTVLLACAAIALQQAWVYHPGGTRFEDRVGAILSRGTNLQVGAPGRTCQRPRIISCRTYTTPAADASATTAVRINP